MSNRYYNGNTMINRSYLCDEGSESDWAVLKSDVSDGSHFWDVYVLDEQITEGAFGANAKSKYTHDGKYYTTMYAPFPYKLLDGVKAYYLPISEQSYNKDTHTAIFRNHRWCRSRKHSGHPGM